MKSFTLVLFTVAIPALSAASFPRCGNVTDITKTPYSAKADGVTDDTEALQRAINENVGRHRLLYFPGGTYLVSSTLTWPKRFAVPALSTYGTLCLLDAKLTGRVDAASKPAIVNYNGGRIFLRDIATSGYGRALGDASHMPGGGHTEILGGFSYTTTAGKLAPMFLTENSSVWTFFAEVCFNGDPFTTRIMEKRGAETKTISRGDGYTTPYSGQSPKR